MIGKKGKSEKKKEKKDFGSCGFLTFLPLIFPISFSEMMVDNNVQDTRFVYRTDESRQLKQKIRDRGYTKIQDGG